MRTLFTQILRDRQLSERQIKEKENARPHPPEVDNTPQDRL